MNKSVKRAWEQTFKKWEYAVLHNGRTIHDCGLCNEFEEGVCGGCPVSKISGNHSCLDTPFDLAFDQEGAEMEYMFLQLVYLATKDDEEYK